MTTRLGVDVGGTFTDLIFYDEASGETRVAKAPTTPASPEQGILHAVAAGVPGERLQAAEFFLHGTTVGLNALLERRGAVVGLLATEGFRDVLEIRRGDRVDMYDLFWRQPEPLVPRRLRLPVRERLFATGEVHTPIDARRRPRRGGDVQGRGLYRGRDRLPARLRQRRARAGGGERAARGRVRRRDLALAPGQRRVPRVRAHDDDGDRRVRARADGQLPRPAGERARRAGLRRAPRW